MDLEAGVGPSTSGAGSPSGPGPSGLSLPPSTQPTSQPTSPVATGTPALILKTPTSGKPPSRTPAGSGTPAAKTPGSGKLVTPASKQGSKLAEEIGSPTKTPGVKSKTPASKTPHESVHSKQATPVAQPSPTKSSPRKQSRAEAAEEVIARSQASQRSALLVTPAKSSKSVVSAKVLKHEAEEDRGSDRSISPSQRFTPNRGLTEAEIF